MTKRSVTKKPELTQWFDGSVKPVRVGLYQTGWGNEDPLKSGIDDPSPWLWYWDGVAWRDEKSGKFPSAQNRYWRVLAQNPEVQP